MTSENGEEQKLLKMNTLNFYYIIITSRMMHLKKLDYASRMMHLNFWRGQPVTHLLNLLKEIQRPEL